MLWCHSPPPSGERFKHKDSARRVRFPRMMRRINPEILQQS
jgi:hypothetical protein